MTRITRALTAGVLNSGHGTGRARLDPHHRPAPTILWSSRFTATHSETRSHLYPVNIPNLVPGRQETMTLGGGAVGSG